MHWKDGVAQLQYGSPKMQVSPESPIEQTALQEAPATVSRHDKHNHCNEALRGDALKQSRTTLRRHNTDNTLKGQRCAPTV